MRKALTILCVLAVAGLAWCADVVLGKIGDLTFSGSGTTFVGSFGSAVDVGSPEAWWKMTATGTNETQILDFANSYNASNKPTVATGPAQNTTNGVFYFFDGSDDRFEAGDNLDMGTNDYTMMCWINTDTASVVAPMSKAKQALGDRWWITLNNTAGKVRFALDTGGGGIAVDSSNTVTDATWHHVAGTYDRNGNLIVYVDGIHDGQVDISSLDGDNLQNVQIFQIGAFRTAADNGPALLYSGYLDDPRVFLSALTPTQIQNIYNEGRQ